MANLLMVDPDKCGSCRTCEMVCSMKHEGNCNPTLSRIKVLKYDQEGSHYLSVPVVCQQCETPLCMKACPMNAISKNIETELVSVNENTCVGCRMCTIACPVGSIEINPDTDIAFKCDLCDGDPLCVEYCHRNAITFVDKDLQGHEQRRRAIKTLSDQLTLITGLPSIK